MNKTLAEDNLVNMDFTTDKEVNPIMVGDYISYFDKVVDLARSTKQYDFGQEYSSKEYNVGNFEDFYLSKLIEYRPFINKYYSSRFFRTHALGFVKMKGIVTTITDDIFEARLYEKEDEEYEIAEFDITDVDPDDMDLFEVGAVFYWTFGHYKIDGQVKKQSEIRFQRIAPILPDEFDEIVDMASDLNNTIIWD